MYKDIVLTGELMFTQSLSNINYYNANLENATQSFGGPDTRPRFPGIGLSGTALNNALRVVDKITDATVMNSRPYGSSVTATVQIQKPTRSKGLGWNLAYNYARVRDFMTPGSIAFSSWTAIQSVNGNNRPDIAFSDNEIRNRFMANLNYRIEMGKFSALQFSLFGTVPKAVTPILIVVT
ncbi:MAG: hypothetical protein EAZ62_08370 [Sphingobacteriia bacterium]|nr:MAG: hypothetical protein EAZ62_08370 [Sphingobacteriia bacterium]